MAKQKIAANIAAPATPAVSLSPSVRAKAGAEFLGIGESTFWSYVASKPDFPQAKKYSPRVSVWRLEDLALWRDRQGA